MKLEVGAVTESIQVEASLRCSKPRPLRPARFWRATRSSRSPCCRSMRIRDPVCICPPPPTSTANTSWASANGRIGYTIDGVGGKEPVRIARSESTNEVSSTTIDALQEVKLFTTGMPAEFGHSAGGLLPTVFKTGGPTDGTGQAEDRYIKKETDPSHLPRATAARQPVLPITRLSVPR